VPAIPAIEAPLIEIFSSMQGEGVLVGCRQVFVRFADCNLACDYCDTPFQHGPICRIETPPGSGQFTNQSNLVKLSQVTCLLGEWQELFNHMHHSVVLTGGEPLLHADILREWLPDVLPILPVFLETNGTLPMQLVKVLPFLEWISMDIKGAAATGSPTPWEEHADFMKLASARLCQVKLVVDVGTSETELLTAARLVNRYAPDVPFILQPRTLARGPALGGAALLRMQQIVAEEHRDVRIIPQIHSWLGVT
jgi:7-carboxy-7-deazaguanine synthase